MKYRFIIYLLFISCAIQAQTKSPDLHQLTDWQVVRRTAELVRENDKKAIRLNEVPSDGLMWLKDADFATGTVEFDVKGQNKPQQSFVGLAFHGQDDQQYEGIYFRPFNFMNADTIRRPRSVQYVSMPDNPWEKLRESFPGKYENKVNPVPDPDGWFHVKVSVEEKSIRVFVNHSSVPSLQVESLSKHRRGKIGFWVGYNSGGTFANLVITPSQATAAMPYGNNPQAGRYVQVGDARLYYEVYGKGKPLVMLHGGVYGYINEFAPFIPKLAESFQVICIATRGHGKSEIGKTPATWKQRAEDAYQVIRSITKDSVTVIGFSDGALSGYKLAAIYPQVVRKLVAIGAGDLPKGARKEKFSYTADGLLSQAKDYFESRLKLMPEPKRWNESLSMLNKLYNEDYLSGETFGKIQCPVLVMSGDRDAYHTVENVAKAAKLIRNSQLSVIPGCSHVVFYCNFPAVWESLVPFIGSEKSM
jgi:pimeloyl-ACP methyl ester carboxylesterase